jgi:hypothetical protein
MAERLEFICKYVYFIELGYNTQTARMLTQLFLPVNEFFITMTFELRPSDIIN